MKNDTFLKINALLRPVVRVNSLASGLLVYSKDKITIVITNAHVVEDQVKDKKRLFEAPFVTVDRFKYDSNGKYLGFYQCDAEIIAYDEFHDLAALILRDNDDEPMLVDIPTKKEIKTISVFDEITLIGCALSDQPTPTTGIISSINIGEDKREFWMTSAPLFSGNSGGGCFKYHDGRYILVGMPTAMRAAPGKGKKQPKILVPHINYMVPITKLKGFIKLVLASLDL